MATERKRRRSTSPQRSPGELADTLARLAATTKDPPPRRRPRFEHDPDPFAPSAEPAPRHSALLTPSPEAPPPASESQPPPASESQPPPAPLQSMSSTSAREVTQEPEASPAPSPPQEAAGGLAIGSRLVPGPAGARHQHEPRSRASGRSPRRTRASAASADREGSNRLGRARPKARSDQLTAAHVTGSRFGSRASGRVGQRTSRTASRRSHVGRRFVLLVLAVIALVLLVLVLIGGSSSGNSPTVGAKPTAVPVPVPATDNVLAPPATQTATATPPATTATTASQTTHAAAAPAKAKAKPAAHKPAAHKAAAPATPHSPPATTTPPVTTTAPVYSSPAPYYAPAAPARQSLSGVGALSGGTQALSRQPSRHRER